MRGRWRLAAAAAVALLSVGTAACGDDDEGSDSSATSAAAEASAEVSSAAAEATSAAESVASEAESAVSEAESAATSAAEEATSAAAEEPAIEPVTLRIGFSGALEGPYAAYDATLLKGMEYASKKLAEAGDPVTVEIVSKNNKGDQALAATTTQELIDDGVKVFVLTTADPYAAQGSLITAAGGVMSVGGNTAPQIAKDLGDRAFFFVFGDNVQASADAEYACQQGYKNAWIIGSEEIPYTKDLPKYFKDAFEKCGGTIVGEDVYKIGQTEFRTQVTKIQNADPAPDVIFTPMFVPDSGIFLKALRGAGVTTPFLATDGNDSTLFADSGGDAVDGAVFSTHGFAGSGAVADFLADFEKVMGAKAESNTFEAIGRDNVYALVAAVKAAGGSVEPDDLKTAIEGLKDVPLLTGNMTMDPATHIPIKDVTLIKMNGTTQELVQTKTPDYIAAP
jgi:branched-chain amino acid transport system substrate-binding protein